MKILRICENDAFNEIDVLENCKDHENIVNMIECITDSYHHYIVLELLNGEELYKRIQNQQTFEESTAKQIFYQIIRSVQFLHDNGIVHADLKPENVIVDESSDQIHVKVIDFGFSCASNTELSVPKFTLDYAAPESLLPGVVKEMRDIWSLGIILYMMLCGVNPFKTYDIPFMYQKKEERIMAKIREGRINTINENWKNLRNELKYLITQMLSVDEKLRPTIDEIMAHEWFQDLNSLCDSTVVEMLDDESEDESTPEVMLDSKIEIQLPVLTPLTQLDGNEDKINENQVDLSSFSLPRLARLSEIQDLQKNEIDIQKRFSLYLGVDENDNFAGFAANGNETNIKSSLESLKKAFQLEESQNAVSSTTTEDSEIQISTLR